jgi:hypothetical protein
MNGVYTIRKYMGDDQYSWAVFRKIDIPKGHRGIVCDWDIKPVMTGLGRTEAAYQRDQLESWAKA